MTNHETKYGIINEDTLSLRYPRAVDGDPHDRLIQAIKSAAQEIEDGAEEVVIVKCRYSKRHEVWVEVDGGQITLDASSAHEKGWFDEPDEAVESAS